MSPPTVLFTAWIFVILVLGWMEGCTNAQTVENTTQESGDNLGNTINSGGNESSAAPPEFVAVSETTGRPCILATFNITVRVSYTVDSNGNANDYIAFKDVVVPPPGETDQLSICGDNVSSLALDWGNSTFSLNLTLAAHNLNNEGAFTNWSLAGLGFSFDLADKDMFPGAKEDDHISVAKNDLRLFNAPIGQAVECDRDTDVQLGDEDNGAEVTFHYIKLAAFNLTSEEFPTDVVQCEENSTSMRDEDIMVPLIIACCLSLVVIIVVIAYAISRKVQETRDQTQYKPMP